MSDDLKDEYFLRKNQNCIFQPYIVRNASARLGMSHLKTEGILMKSVHLRGTPSPTSDSIDSYSGDLTPLVTYSLNKRKRWVVLENVGDQMLENVQVFHENSADEILFLERVNLKTFDWKYLPYVTCPQDFHIQTLHSCKKSGDTGEVTYSKSTLNSIFGQTYSHFLDKNRKSDKKIAPENEKDEKSTLVVYNFIRAPKNYMRLGEQHFVASNFGGRYPYYAYMKRKANWNEFKSEIKEETRKHYANKETTGNDNDLDTCTEERNGCDRNQKTKYYDLYTHLKEDFVFVKRGKHKH
ncbi:hypothetical protein CRE_08373 [Caenorhabditis remanei]|uniref:Uncharacterized protein n=1 Tax=Caenorhabditis remanei TaxID=31234 RepID=E3MPE2_CAERE|nr:hypothetical protein CRE_08373 [Caenorhabditis remanei]